MFDLIRFDHNSQRFVMRDLRPPANAFEWERFVVEEAERRGETPNALNANNTSRKRSIASTQAIERIRVDQPGYGTIGMSKKTAEMIALKPKTFNVYGRARAKKESAA
jgi:hypothetical protein